MEKSKSINTMEFIDLPSENHPKFQEFIHPSWQFSTRDYHPSMNTPSEPQPQRQNIDKRSAPYVSFGDKGTTATAGLYGSLIRICRPVPVNHLHSGIVALGLLDGGQACYASLRADKFLRNAQSVTSGFGLRVLNAPRPQSSPVTEFLGDRWPVISYITDGDCQVSVRLWCQQNVTIQHMQIQNPMRASESPKVGLDVNFCLQDLDCVEKRDDLEVEYHRAPHGYGVIVMEKNKNIKSHGERICVLISVFMNGKGQKIHFKNKNDLIKMPAFSEPEVEFTAVFKIFMGTRKLDWQSFMVSKTDVYCDPLPTVPAGLDSSLSQDRQLIWHFRRNLEHILSVCSIPVDVLTAQDDSSLSANQNEKLQAPMITIQPPTGREEVLHPNRPVQPIQPIALTCGDFGDHHISISGSYFAFMFMLEIHERLPKKAAARQRIHAVCKGHLEWVKKLKASEAYCSNITVNGKRIHYVPGTSLLPDSPANMPTHILKATEYLKSFPGLDDLFFVCSWLGKFAVEWFQQLVETRQHLTPTWQHSPVSEIPIFRLSDQIIIWKALRSIEKLIKHVEKTHRMKPHERLKEFIETMHGHLPLLSVQNPTFYPTLDFIAEDLRRQNLRRFTLKFVAEKDQHPRRSLSVTRSARETRFLFHSRDTILYYGLEWGFFVGEETVWEELVHAQIQHDDPRNDQARWDNPLRYGLALEMAKHGHQLERNFLPSEMFKHARQFILGCSSVNGLFPGQLDDFSKQPVVYRKNERNCYFHVTFEIPYLLLRAAEDPIPSKWQPDAAGIYKGSTLSSPPEEEDQPPPDPNHLSVDRPSSSSSVPISRPEFTSAFPAYSNLAVSQTIPSQRTILKRRIPYGKITDFSNIVELEEEWLFKYPDFLDFTPPTNIKELNVIREAIADEPQYHYMNEAMQDTRFRSIVELSKIQQRSEPCFAIIYEVRKDQELRRIHSEEKSVSKTCSSWLHFWENLKIRRTSMNSKRRLIYLRTSDNFLATMCYIASPPSERNAIRLFFDRHGKVHVSYFYDNTSAVLNRWETEVHFRFFNVLKTKEAGFSPSSAVRQLKGQECKTFGKNAYLVDTVLSFRILGDFFDRYWTCHLANSFAQSEEPECRSTPHHEKKFMSTHWQKRKVLELCLMSEILERVCYSTETILHCIEHGPESNASMAKKKGEAYFSKDSFEDRRPAELRECFQLLVIVKNNVNSLQGLVEQWNYRQNSQGRESTRWTRSNEQKYGDTVKQKMAQFEDHVREIKATASRIDFLIVLVTNAQDAIRSNREEENITLFTYLNVFFLPVGLAVAIFSANGTPEGSVLGYMVATAAVAFLVTICVLVCVVCHLIPVSTHGILKMFRNMRLSGNSKRVSLNQLAFRDLKLGSSRSKRETCFDLEDQGKKDVEVSYFGEESSDWHAS